MKRIEITMEKRMALVFEATDEEVETLQKGVVPDRIQETFDKADWIKDSWQDYAVWDCDEEKQIIEFN